MPNKPVAGNGTQQAHACGVICISAGTCACSQQASAASQRRGRRWAAGTRLLRGRRVPAASPVSQQAHVGCRHMPTGACLQQRAPARHQPHLNAGAAGGPPCLRRGRRVPAASPVSQQAHVPAAHRRVPAARGKHTPTGCRHICLQQTQAGSLGIFDAFYFCIVSWYL